VLAVYVAPESVDTRALLDHMRAKLPEFMVSYRNLVFRIAKNIVPFLLHLKKGTLRSGRCILSCGRCCCLNKHRSILHAHCDKR
jgi:hypothetical protein